jgi:hypothetical protein
MRVIRYYSANLFGALSVPRFTNPRLAMVILAVFFSFGYQNPHGAQESSQTQALTALPSAEALKACMNSRDGAECMDKLFREALKKHSTLEALQLIQRLGDADPEVRRDCHPIVHAIGRETFRIKENIHNSFSACDQTCHSGCYHGAVERFLRGENIYAEVDKHPSTTELKQKAASACDPKIAARYRFQCLHGLGHALLFFSGYKLEQSLDVCDILPEDWDRASCYGGVFMENVFNATPEKRDLSPSDFHYPCNKVQDKYRYECYVMQTSRMTEMGLNTEKIFHECAKTGDYQIRCAISIGRDLSNEVRLGQIRSVAEKCQLAAGEPGLACIRGVVYALIDNTWDGRYALPFCAALSRENEQSVCYRESIDYLKDTFEAPPAAIAKDCAKYLSQPKPCLALAAR